MLVREENLASAKSKLKDVMSVHVYSVQKTKLPDMSVLYTANYDKVKENVLSINKWVFGKSVLVCLDDLYLVFYIVLDPMSALSISCNDFSISVYYIEIFV